MSAEVVTVVSGLPRSGTSMMMKMLDAGGMQILTDNIRTADEDNPKGYYEFERVKKIEHDKAWLPEAQGKAVKLISALLRHLPDQYRYKILFMRRAMAEVLASQRQMLVRRGKPVDGDDAKMAEVFERHLRDVEAWLAKQPNMEVLYVSYNEMLKHPALHVRQVNCFLGNALDETEMARVVDQSLHRQRA